ncbi:MAG TPA: restriction endonuclease subunit S, partial [Panacibacter sp.]|nr:restriction endonuclease subunit S [Panacibacter sp.]
MNGWKEHKWGEIATLEYGKGLANYQNDNGKYPVFGTNGKIGTSDIFLNSNPGIIIGRKGAYRGVHYSTTPFYVIDTAFYLKPKINDLDIKYAYYQLLTKDINSMDSGSAIPSTSREDFYDLNIYLPPFKEQKLIAETLTGLDDKIDLLQRQNKTLEQLAETLFRQWF